MATSAIQSSFNTGEWAPALNARVDMAKYHSAAALLENYFVDYRGGASTRPGTKYILQAKDSTRTVRLISFQASFDVGYIIEMGHLYMRFHRNGSPILEPAQTITNVTNADPCRITSTAHGWSEGDWIFVSGVGGLTEVNQRYFIVTDVVNANIVEVSDLLGIGFDTSAFGAYTSGGSARRVYTIDSPYGAGVLRTVKFCQNVSTMILCHPTEVPYALTLIESDNWTLIPISFGAGITAPGGISVTTNLGGGIVNYAYKVSSVDANGQESEPSTAEHLDNREDLRVVATKSNDISWNARSGAASYNVYKSEVSTIAPVPDGVPYGFIGNCTGTTFIDSNIEADFSQSPPIARNPFAPGAAVASVTVTNGGSYTTLPTLSFTDPGGGGITAVGRPVMRARTAVVVGAGVAYNVGDLIVVAGNVVLEVTAESGPGNITDIDILNPGSRTAALPSNPVAQDSTDGGGSGATFNLTWEVGSVELTNPGSTYALAPTITFSAGTAAADANLGPDGVGNPSVPTLFQQRLCLAAPDSATQTLFFSQPGSFYNFNISNPVQGDNAITASLVSGQLNNIKSLVSQPAGLLVLSDSASWIVNGGGQGTAIEPTAIVANAQSFNGASDVPPIVCNFDILYVQAKGSIIRDSSYNFYANVFTGTDISVLSSHLFYGYTIDEWCWAEEPFKLVYAIRDDGVLLNLTFMKEQEFCGWSHSTTDGLFRSVATIIEEDDEQGFINGVYTVVRREIEGIEVRYIERFSERIFPNGVEDAWCVDAGLQYDGVPKTNFSGAEHLWGKTCVGLADGVPIEPFEMDYSGEFTLPEAASKVTIGLKFTPKFQTLALDTGEPTVQGKVKKIASVILRCQDTLGLKIGQDFDHLVPMKDLVVGNVSSQRTGLQSQLIDDLVTGDARTIIDPSWNIPGQYCVQLDDPYPATIQGVIPQFTVEGAR